MFLNKFIHGFGIILVLHLMKCQTYLRRIESIFNESYCINKITEDTNEVSEDGTNKNKV